MSFKLITNDMIVKNNIILEPRITFVSASNLCEDLVSHEIDSAGIYGDVPALNTVNTYFSGSDSPGTRVYNVNNRIDRMSSSEGLKLVNILNEARNDSSNFERELNENGISFDSKYTHKFGVEKSNKNLRLMMKVLRRTL